MSRERLRRILEQLHAELASANTTHTADESLRDRVRQLEREIGDALAKDTPPASLRDRLENEVAEFEVSYPTLARRLAEVIDTLALYGL